MTAAQCRSIVTSQEQWQKYLEWENDQYFVIDILYHISPHVFISSVKWLLALLWYCSSAVTGITNSKKRPDFRTGFEAMYNSCLQALSGDREG
jgi:hypothetical protein